jgi:dihydrodipicolinate synthase/N-acetylneuraminate lyase
MDREKAIKGLSGCYIALPALFRDGDLELNLAGMRRHVRFLLEGGVRTGNGVFLVGGAAGDFTTLTVAERLKVAEAVVDEAAGRVGVIVGAQSTDLRDTVALARGAQKLGALATQIAPPYYHPHTEGDILEFLTAASEAADVAAVVYTTYWHNKTPLDLLAKVAELPNVAGLKFAAPTALEYHKGVKQFADKLCVIDNQGELIAAHLLGARGVNTHMSNYWPEWGVRFWGLLEARKYAEAQDELTRVYVPYYDLSYEVAAYTGGEGMLDKLCMELVGLDSSRCRPPSRDIRPGFREKARKMLQRCGVLRCK